MIAYAEEIGLDPQTLLEAFREIPVMTKEHFDDIAAALFTITEQLSTIAYQNIQQTRFIVERRKAEEDLRITLNSIGDAVIATDAAGYVVRMNPVAERMCGWDVAEAVGKPLAEILQLIEAESRSSTPSPYERVIECQGVATSNVPTVLVSRDGTEFRIADSGAPIQSRTGGPIQGVVIVFRNVTKELELQEQLQQSRKMDALGQLAGGIAHDFNNMLGGILSSAEILKKHVSSETGEKFLNIIADSARNAADITNKMLVFSRKSTLDIAPTNIHDAIQEALDLSKHSIKHDVEVVCALDAADARIQGNAGQLQNMFINILLNANQAIERFGTLRVATRVVELDAAYCEHSTFDICPGKYIECEVRDDGHGIKPQHMPHIYEPFFTTKLKGGGKGLGLSSVYATIKQHKGMISIFSEEGEGTAVKLYLPLIQHADIQKTINSPTADGDDFTVLVVEDEEAIRVTYESILMEFGYKVRLAETGNEGMEIFEREHEALDAVVLDMILPGMSGRACFHAMQQIDAHVPVILSSGFADAGNVKELRKQGLFDTVSKPCTSVQLGQVVARAVKWKHDRAET